MLMQQKFSLKMSENNVVVMTKLQTFTSMKFSRNIDNVLFNLIISHSILSEQHSPGSFDDCILRTFEILSRNCGYSPINAMKEHSSSNEVISSTYPTVSDVDTMVEHFCVLDEMKSLAKQSLNLAGFASRISIEKSKAPCNSIELFSGQTFDVENPLFKSRIDLKFPKVVLIDGFIESVAEVHHLLTQASETKESILLFVRGMSKDVMSTLKVNLDRKTLNVHPVLVNFDQDGINTLADLNVISGSDVVTSLKGDLISSIDLSSFKSIEQASFVERKKLIIKNEKNKANILNHVNSLKKRRDSAEHDMTRKLFDARIKSLFSNQVIVRLIDNHDFVIRSQCLDYVFRAYKSLISHGVTQGTLTSNVVYSKLFSSKCTEIIGSLGAILA